MHKQRRTQSGSNVISVKDLQVRFPSENGVVHAVRGVSFDLAAGEVLGIVGESGSGKSVTSLAIMGLLPDTARASGSVTLHGDELLGQHDTAMSKLRGNEIAMVFQDPLSSLTPIYTIGAQLVEALQVHSDISKAAATDRAVELLDLVGIPNPKIRVKSFPHEFSGGMRQRAMIAMAIANEPDLLIADEPTTALDVTVQAQVMEVLERIQERTSSSLLLITHDLGVVAGVADRIMVMYAGRDVEQGTVDEIFYDPRHPYTRGLLGSLPRIDRREAGAALNRIRGNPPSLLHLPPGCPFWPRCPYAERGRCDQERPAMVEVAPGRLVACVRVDELPSWEEERG